MTRGTVYWHKLDGTYASRIADAPTETAGTTPPATAPNPVIYLVAQDGHTLSLSALLSTVTAPATIVSYAWTFGDGGQGTTQNVSHTYATAGIYVVSLAITDSRGAVATTTSTLFVQDAVILPPVPVLSLLNSQGLTLSASAEDLSYDPNPGGTVLTGVWDWGDGSATPSLTATHAYSKSGTYTVKVTISNNLGKSATLSQVVTMSPQNTPPVVILAPPVYNHFSVSFDASSSYDSSGTIVSTTWDFGDGTVATGTTTSHTYATLGPWLVTVKCSDSNGMFAVATQTVTPS